VKGDEEARKSFEYEASGVVITLPLGVLKAKQVGFYPRLPEKESLVGKIGWGHVVRVVFRFKNGFWSAPFMPQHLGAAQGKNFGFVNAPGQPVPVWWTTGTPAPMLCGWAGGEVARPLQRLSPASVREEALRSLADILGTTRSKLRGWVAGWQYHPWSTDLFARGAYSYPVAGSEHAGQELARPIASTLFFAGEATAEAYGTVHGALESGLRAAKEMDQALRQRRSVR